MSSYEIRYLSAVVNVLEEYLLSDDLYWPPGISAKGGEPPYPSITPGSLCLFRLQARSRNLTTPGKAEFLRIDNDLLAILSSWQVAWEKKVIQDFHARLQLWGNFLDDLREKSESHLDRYPYEVTRRVQLDLLRGEVKRFPEADLRLLELLDRKLKAMFRPGDFIWEPVFETVYPKPRFWYLYGMVKDL
jgi:hypothetical protein